MLPIDAGAATAFLCAIEPNPNKFVFQTYADVKPPTARVDRSIVGAFDIALPALQQLTDQGAAVAVQVNEGLRGAAHITRVRALFIDLDSPDAASLQQIAMIMPPPSAIVCSSPGKYHVYWRVTDCPTEHFKAAQLRLAGAFRSDNTICNLDRVMRLPGTWHQKLEPWLVRLVVVRDVSYPYMEITSACVRPLTNTIPAPSRAYRKQKSITDAMILASEKFTLPESIGHGTRTTTLVQLIGQMADMGHSAEAITEAVEAANIERCTPPLTDAELQHEVFPAISRFIKRVDVVTTAATLQPESRPGINEGDDFFGGSGGKPSNFTPRTTIDEFLRRYVLIEDSAQIADLESTARQTDVLDLADWKVARMNQRAGENALATNWLMSPMRKRVASSIYYPSESKIVTQGTAEFYNTYRPPELQPATSYDASKIAIWREHIAYLFGSGTDAEALFLQWFALTVQSPHLRVPWAPLIVSAPGLGKGWLFQCLQKLLGEHNCAMITSDDIGERKGIYNEWIAGTTLVCIDEMDSGSKWADMNRLKGLITEPYQEVNKKYGTKRKEQVFANFLCFSNMMSAAALPEDDRRFWVHKVANGVNKSPGYYKRLFDWLDTDGPSHLLAKCRSIDLTSFNYAEPPPMTDGKREMIDATQSAEVQIIQYAIEHKVGAFAADVVSAIQIRDHILAALGEEKANEAAAWRIKTAITNTTSPLRQKYYTVSRNTKTAQVHLRAVRNNKFWWDRATGTVDAVVTEYLRSIQLEHGVNPQKLRIVTNE